MAEHSPQSDEGRGTPDRSSPRRRRRISKDFWVLVGVVFVAFGWFIWVARVAMTSVGKLVALEALILSGSNVADEQTVPLLGLTRLRWLELSLSDVTGAALANLRNMA